jgi:phosphate butyryltransferase
MIKSFDEVLAAVKGLPRSRVAVAAAHDDAVLDAVKGASELGIADFVLVADEPKLKKMAAEMGVDLSGVEVIHEPDARKAAYKAVALTSSGEADMFMKGMVSTADFLRAVLDKEVGLRTGSILSHSFVFEMPGFDRLLLVTDPAMNVAPTLAQKADIIQNAAGLARVLGINPPKVAVLAAVETVNPDMPATLDAAALAKMAERGQIKGAIIDGPLALDNAISVEAAHHKGIKSPVAGLADILMVPDIEAGNMLGKAMVYFGRPRMAGLVLGASKPVVATSRADSADSKVMSLALGALVGAQGK